MVDWWPGRGVRPLTYAGPVLSSRIPDWACLLQFECIMFAWIPVCTLDPHQVLCGKVVALLEGGAFSEEVITGGGTSGFPAQSHFLSASCFLTTDRMCASTASMNCVRSPQIVCWNKPVLWSVASCHVFELRDKKCNEFTVLEEEALPFVSLCNVFTLCHVQNSAGAMSSVYVHVCVHA